MLIIIHFTLRQLQENTTVCANLLGSVFVIRNTLVELSSVTLSDKTQGGGGTNISDLKYFRYHFHSTFLLRTAVYQF